MRERSMADCFASDAACLNFMIYMHKMNPVRTNAAASRDTTMNASCDAAIAEDLAAIFVDIVAKYTPVKSDAPIAPWMYMGRTMFIANITTSEIILK
jgi:hypothetical protein